MISLDDEQGAPEASEQPSGELTVDGGKTDSETVGEPSSSKQGEDTLEKPDSEVTEGVPVGGKAASTEEPGGSEEKKSSGEVHRQLPAVIEQSSEIGADPVTETQVDVEALIDSESKTDHGKDKLGEAIDFTCSMQIIDSH